MNYKTTVGAKKSEIEKNELISKVKERDYEIQDLKVNKNNIFNI